jgi:succinyl-diaminopimelate desuccinylase
MKLSLKQKQDLVSLTQKLISFPSVVGDFEQNRKILDFCEEYLGKQNLLFRRYKFAGVESLVVSTKKTKRFDVILYAHLDVVSPCGANDFNPVLKGNRIYGRGSGDMKSAAAVVIEVMRFIDANCPNWNVGLFLTTDEEVGGENGVGYLLQKQKFSGKFAFVPDSAGDVGQIITDQKGVLHLKAWEFGVEAHGSRPHLGENAIEKLMKKLRKLKRKFPKSNPARWAKTLNIGKIRGGEQTNQVPGFAEAFLDIRFINNAEKIKIDKFLEKIFSSNFEVMIGADAFVADCNDVFFLNYIN